MANRHLIVIGAGAAGMLAAGTAARQGASVTLLEKMAEPGKKVLISGKTRCNLTNSAELDDFIRAYGPNGRFLYTAFSRFFREDLLAFLRTYGVETKVERGGRIFPVSDDAADVVRAFRRYLHDNRVDLKLGEKVVDIISQSGSVDQVITRNGAYPAAAVILAAGGASWPATGSTGDGFKLAQSLGHTLTALRPALVPLVVEDKELAQSMQGVSLRNVRLTAYRCAPELIDAARANQIIDSRQGELMITHFGLGGPLTLLMSKAVVLALETGPVSVAIDLKPALEIKQLQQRLQRDFDTFPKRSFQNILKEMVPLKMVEPLALLSGIPREKPGHQIGAIERNRLASLLKSLRFSIAGSLPLSAAMVTSGGVSLKEIDPRTLSSRLVKGLYFCGEVMDIDADTGGYNLQAAFSTGYLAGISAAAFLKSDR